MVHTTYSVTLLVLLLAKSVEQGGAVTVPIGGFAVLSCDMVYDLTKELVWLDGHKAVLRRLPNGDLHDFHPFVDRVSLVDIVNLRIENVRLKDEGRYECQQEGAVTNGTPQDLEIALPPDPAAPTITDYSGGDLTAGSMLTLTCVSTGGRPPSDLTWWTGDTQVKASSSHTTDSTGQGDTRSELTIPELQPSHNGAVYQCRASQLALPKVETDQVTLSVAYGPQNIQATCDLSDLREGGALECTCTADSNPVARYSWIKDSTAGPLPAGAIVNQTAGTMTFNSLNRTHSGVYSCTVTNSISSAASDSITVDVKYGPQNVQVTCDPSVSDLSDLREGGALECTCTADSNPAARYSWMKGTERLSTAVVDSTAGTLTYTTLHAAQSGEYRCVAENDVGNQTSHSIPINVKDAVLSGGEIAGIGIGVFFALGAVIGATALITICCYKNRQGASGTNQSSGGQSTGTETRSNGYINSTEMSDMGPDRATHSDQHNGPLGVDLPNESDSLLHAPSPSEPQSTETATDPEEHDGSLHVPEESAPSPSEVQSTETDPEQHDGSLHEENEALLPASSPSEAQSTETSLSALDGACGGQHPQDNTRLSAHTQVTDGPESNANLGVALWTDICKILDTELTAQLRSDILSELGLDQVKIRKIEEEFREQMKLERMLAQWLLQDSTASPPTLVRALKKCGCPELADKVDKCWQQRYEGRGVC